MVRSPRPLIPALLAVAVLVAGCVGTDKALSYLGSAELEYYKDVATQIDYSHVGSSTEQDALATEEPRTLSNRRADKPVAWPLQKVLHTALQNNRIIRSNASFLSPANSLFTNAEGTPSVYDPGIQQSGVLFGRRGLEAALAEFDTTFSTSMLWGRSENVQNSFFFGGGLTPGGTLTQESGAFRSGLTKRFADGGLFTMGHDWDYRGSNAPAQLFNSVYTGNLRAEYRRPLWAGSGVEFTRTAGPINPAFGAIAGVSQGVLIARINTDITLAEFESAVRNHVKDVEDLYWELYLRYQQYHTRVVERESAAQTWHTAKGDPKAKRQDGPQARDRYFAAKAAADTALSDLFTTETRLRRLIGLPVNDGTVIQPSDKPSMGALDLSWQHSLAEALTRRVELRKQKWNIKSLELQLSAARSLTNPRFDFVTNYQVNGFGDNLLGQNDNDTAGSPQGLNSGYETLTQGNQTAWGLGFEFSMPLGFRSAKSQVRSIELRLLKARQVLAAQELDISHEMAVAFQNLSLHLENVKSNTERRKSAKELVGILKVQVEGGLATVDELLRAQSALAQADLALYQSIVLYNQAITNLHFRKGTLLEFNAVYLAEGQWSPKAYEQALRRAWARSHGVDASRFLKTKPLEFVRPRMELPLEEPTGRPRKKPHAPPVPGVEDILPPLMPGVTRPPARQSPAKHPDSSGRENTQRDRKATNLRNSFYSN